MSVLLIAEHNNKELKPFTLNAITAAFSNRPGFTCFSDWA